MSDSVTPWPAARQALLLFTLSLSLLKLMMLSRWCYQTISSSVTPLSSCPQSFPASGSFPVSRFFASHGLSIGASASASVLSTNIPGWFPLELTDLISCSPRDSQESFPAPQFKSIGLSLLYGPTLTSIHDHWKNDSGKTWSTGGGNGKPLQYFCCRNYLWGPTKNTTGAPYRKNEVGNFVAFFFQNPI